MTADLPAAELCRLKKFYIFPCERNGKKPLLPFKEKSTINAGIIERYWSAHDDNIAVDCGKSGLFVVDVDCKQGKEGKASYEKLHSEFGFPETFTVKTPSGGIHLYYAGSGYGNTQGDKGGPLGAGIDTRGEGGYVLAPGSSIDGKAYTIFRNVAPVAMPDWLKEKMSSHRSVASRDAAKTITEDSASDILAAMDFLKNWEPAVEGAGGDHHTFVTICRLKERGIGKAMAYQLLEECWNDRCQPPWGAQDLKKKIDSAWKSAQNATGVLSPQSEFADMPDSEPAKINGNQFPFAHDFVPMALQDIPKRDWVFGHLAVRRIVTVMVAPGGTGKSTLSLIMALSLASGRDIIGIKPHARGRVLLTNTEDDEIEIQRRCGALMQHYDIKPEELREPDVLEENASSYIKLYNKENGPFRIVKRGKNHELKPEHADDIAKYLIDSKIDLWIVDPFAETHCANENDNVEILRVASIYRAIAEKANCALMLVHHTRKGDGNSSEGHSGNLDSMRGASSLGGLARIVVTFDSMSRQQAKRYGVEDDQRKRYVLLEQAKGNFTPPGANTMWMERIGEVINISEDDPAGEEIGILRPVKLLLKGKTAGTDMQSQLIDDIEALVKEEPKTIREVAEQLVNAFAFHHDKHPPSLQKAIRRMFSENMVTTPTGLMTLEVIDCRTVIKYEPNETKTGVLAML